MTELYRTIDEQLAAIRAAHESEMQACKDRTLAAEVESALLKEQLAKAVEARAEAEHIASVLLANFEIAEEAFGRARKFALQSQRVPAEGGTTLPINQMETTS